jgi:hypothetical protein
VLINNAQGEGYEGATMGLLAMSLPTASAGKELSRLDQSLSTRPQSISVLVRRG